MWQTETPEPVKLIVGILAADGDCLEAARMGIIELFGPSDILSDTWPFGHTDYYKEQAGEHILRQFVSFERLITPGEIADIKHRTNQLEESLTEGLGSHLPRPINLDPGYVEPGKLVLASTKNFAHRIYIGKNMYAEVTLTFSGRQWRPGPFTFPDYREPRYYGFLGDVRERLIRQRRDMKHQ